MEDITKNRIIIGSIAAIIILLIALFLWWLFWGRHQAKPIAGPGNSTSTAAIIIPEPSAVTSSTQTRINEEKSYPLGLKQVATTFAERYASYSTDELTKSVADLRLVMTDRLYEKLSRQTPPVSGSTFVGYSAVALVTHLVKSDAASAEMTVKLQLTQTIGTAKVTKNFFKTLDLGAVLVGKEWKIDSVKWIEQ